MLVLLICDLFHVPALAPFVRCAFKIVEKWIEKQHTFLGTPLLATFPKSIFDPVQCSYSGFGPNNISSVNQSMLHRLLILIQIQFGSAYFFFNFLIKFHFVNSKVCGMKLNKKGQQKAIWKWNRNKFEHMSKTQMGQTQKNLMLAIVFVMIFSIAMHDGYDYICWGGLW